MEGAKENATSYIVSFSRFDVANTLSGNWKYNAGSDALSLTVNQAVLFHGVRLFGDAHGSQYEVKFTLKYENVTGTYTSEKDKEGVWGYDVMLPKPISLQPDEQFTIIATITGPQSHRGENGKSSVKNDDTVVIFENAPYRSHGLISNGTSKNCGQFYKIFLSKI